MCLIAADNNIGDGGALAATSARHAVAMPPAIIETYDTRDSQHHADHAFAEMSLIRVYQR